MPSRYLVSFVSNACHRTVVPQADIVVIVSILTWIIDGRKNFIGPRDLGALLELARSEVDGEKVNVQYGERGLEANGVAVTEGIEKIRAAQQPTL